MLLVSGLSLISAEEVRRELLAIAEGNTRQTFYVDEADFADAFFNLLVNNNILCESDGMKFSKYVASIKLLNLHDVVYNNSVKIHPQC